MIDTCTAMLTEFIFEISIPFKNLKKSIENFNISIMIEFIINIFFNSICHETVKFLKNIKIMLYLK